MEKLIVLTNFKTPTQSQVHIAENIQCTCWIEVAKSLLNMTEKKGGCNNMLHNSWGRKINILTTENFKENKIQELWNGRLRSTYSETFHMHFSNTYVR